MFFLIIEFLIEMMFLGIIFFELFFFEVRICCEFLVGVVEGIIVFDWIMVEGFVMKILFMLFVKEVEIVLFFRSFFFVGIIR